MQETSQWVVPQIDLWNSFFGLNHRCLRGCLPLVMLFFGVNEFAAGFPSFFLLLLIIAGKWPEERCFFLFTWLHFDNA
jgi:hypothetical protein